MASRQNKATSVDYEAGSHHIWNVGVVIANAVHDESTSQRHDAWGNLFEDAIKSHIGTISAWAHGVIRNLFAVGRHLLRAGHQRLLRARAFVTWNAAALA